MNRRGFLIATGAVLAGGAVGAAVHHRGVVVPTLAGTRAKLVAMRGHALTSHTAWTPAQVFEHMAQSVEYSLTGYPVEKPAAFQHTAGRAAFEVFQFAGAMRHSLVEPIPGAPALVATEVEPALDRLLAAIDTFDAHRGTLKPHFAFGALGHDEFATAHALHIENHLRELVLA